jgi:hypothetical protein
VLETPPLLTLLMVLVFPIPVLFISVTVSRMTTYTMRKRNPLLITKTIVVPHLPPMSFGFLHQGVESWIITDPNTVRK